MAAGRKRREPMFDFLPTPADLRVNARDRAGGDGEAPRRARARRERDEAPARRKRGRGGKGGGRSPFGRLIYWGFVLGLWVAIAAIGTVVWIGAHLPAIQALGDPEASALDPDQRSRRPPAGNARRDGRRGHPAEGDAGAPAAGADRDRGSPVLCSLRLRPDRHGARARRQCAASRRVAGRLDHYPAARQEPVPHAGAHDPPQAAGVHPGALDRAASTARTRSSSSISTASISAPAPTGSRPRRSAISASPRAR